MYKIDCKIIKIFLILAMCEGLVDCVDSGVALRRYYNPTPSKDLTINKVSLTQKGYIQFLKYIVDMPVITEFTFCVWIKSKNLTHNQPILSYSLHEKERHIRAWISPNGKAVNLELLENLLFSVPVKMYVNRWYHICQSWDNAEGTWQFYFHGKLKAQGTSNKLRGMNIPQKGDVVVGQEYTDFDKGLDDGIEGDIYGFNLLLESAAKTVKQTRFTKSSDALFNYPANEELLQSEESTINKDVPSVLGYFPYNSNRVAKSFFTFGENLLKNMFSFFNPSPQLHVRNAPKKTYFYPKYEQIDQIHSQNTRVNNYNRRILNDINLSNNDLLSSKPLGLILIELSFNNCALGKGSPVVDKKVIVSWTKTPVRVFGGAMWKPITPFCKTTNKLI